MAFETTKAVARAMREDYRTIEKKPREEGGGRLAAMRAAGGLALTSAVTIPYLLGGLEASVGWGASYAYDSTHNIAAVAGTTGLISAATEIALTFAVAHSMTKAPKAAKVLEEKKYKEMSEDNHAETKTAGRVGKAILNALDVTATALAAGSPGIIIRSFAKDPSADVAAHRQKGLNTAYVLSGVNVAIGAAAGTVYDVMPGGVTEDITAYSRNALFWIGGLVALKTITKTGSIIKNAVQSHAEAKRKQRLYATSYAVTHNDLIENEHALRSIHRAPGPDVRKLGDYRQVQIDLIENDRVLDSLLPKPNLEQPPSIAPHIQPHQPYLLQRTA